MRRALKVRGLLTSPTHTDTSIAMHPTISPLSLAAMSKLRNCNAGADIRGQRIQIRSRSRLWK